MKRTFLRIIPCAASLLFTGVLGAFVATAADPQPTAPDPQGTGRPDRGNFQGRGGGRGNFGGPVGPGGLGLDDKQRELYREATQKDSDELRKLDDKLRAAQTELMQAVLAETYDEKTVREKADAVAKIQTEITLLRAKALSTVAPTLKPEQREQLETSRMGPAILTGGGFGGGFGGGVGGPPDTAGGFRNRNGQNQPGAEAGPNDRGGRGNGGPQRRRGPGQ